MSRTRLFTIGYEDARSPAQFIEQLLDAGVERLVDIRARAQSRKRGFSKTALSNALADAGIFYEHRPELGNPTHIRALYRAGVVTLGTPHGGAISLASVICRGATLRGAPRECVEMRAGSPLLTSLTSRGWTPQGTGGTDWSTVGSDFDEAVAADRAVGTDRHRQLDMYVGGCHKYWYTTIGRDNRPQFIGHSDYMHNGSVRGGMSATNLRAYTSAGHCGAPLARSDRTAHPMGVVALALGSTNY